MQKKKQLTKVVKCLSVAVVSATIIAGAFLNNISPVFAIDKVVDTNTVYSYADSLGDNASTEFSGRVWTDKSVFNDTVTFTDSNKTIEIDTSNEDFLVSFSALATSSKVTGQTKAPLDVVFIIDLSASMDDKMDDGDTRLKNTIEALNNSVEYLMTLNEYTRVAVAGYGTTATTILPLGHYTKTNNASPSSETIEYFTLNSQESRITFNGYNTSTNRNVTYSLEQRGGYFLEGATNIQMGFYEGMSILANVDSIYADISGQQVKRIPSVVLMSDGAPTVSSSDNEWWSPANNGNDGPGWSYYYGNGMKAMLTAAYMKDRINEKYETANESYKTSLYTIGMGISELGSGYYYDNSEGQYILDPKGLAQVVLNPNAFLNASSLSTHASDIKNAFETYTSNSNKGTPRIVVESEWNRINNQWRENTNRRDYYTVSHPTTGKDITSISNYVDHHYDADKASSVNSVFADIVRNIALSAPEAPTEIESTGSIDDSGLITYTDPIGKYMEVKDVKAIIHNGHQYTQVSSSTEGNVTTYVFEQDVETAIHGIKNLNLITIKVTETNEQTLDGYTIHDEVLTVEIPASLIPLRVNTIDLYENGDVKTHTNNGFLPIRIVYSVGLQNGVLENDVVNTDVVTADYISKYLDADGTVYFLSNEFDSTDAGNIISNTSMTQGEATVMFEPSPTNPFYYMQENTKIYKQYDASTKTFSEPVRSLQELNDSDTYYYDEVYYDGLHTMHGVVIRTGAQLKNTVLSVVNEDGSDYLVRTAGSPRLNRIARFEGEKATNITQTATEFYHPTYVPTPNDGEHDGYFKIYLGNNGKINARITGSLSIAKKVIADNGIEIPDADFTFKISLTGDDNQALTAEYPYGINGISTNQTIKSGDTLTIKANEVITITGLPNGANYKIEEINVPDRFTNTSNEANLGTIEAGKIKEETITNKFTPTAVVVEGIKIQKNLKNKDWHNDEKFAFILESASTSYPMPTGAFNGKKEIIISNGNEYSFGSITFTQLGQYVYTISEKMPIGNERIPGVSYSGAIYQVVVNVTQDANKNLVATSSIVQTQDDSGYVVEQAIPKQVAIFTNTYESKSQTVMFVGNKEYIDESGSTKLDKDDFTFQVEPLDSSNPMPQTSNTINGINQVTNTGVEIAYEGIEFTSEHAKKADNSIASSLTDAVHYQYKLTEVKGSMPGIIYDDNYYIVDVAVYIETYNDSDVSNDTLMAVPTYKKYDKVHIEIDGTYTRTHFVNKYSPTSVDVVLTTTKSIENRDWLDTDTFTFELSQTSGSQVLSETQELELNINSEKVDVDSRTASFKTLTFDKVGTYVFKITESIPTDAVNNVKDGITYDTHESIVTVVITNDSINGQLVASVDYNDDVHNHSAQFVNTYNNWFDTSTSFNLNGTKVLDGKELSAGEFYFDIEAVNDAPLGDSLTSNPNQSNGLITLLKNIKYTSSGDYTYIITEQFVDSANQGNNYTAEGIKYDTTSYTVVVTVSEDFETGRLFVSKYKVNDVTVESENGIVTSNPVDKDTVVFNNSYSAESYIYETKEITKEVENYNSNPSGFVFDKVVVSESPRDGFDINSTTEEYEKLISATTDENGIVKFPSMKFTQSGTYRIAIYENPYDPNIEVILDADTKKVSYRNKETNVMAETYTKNGITYDNHAIVSTFTVVDNLDGTLTVNRSDSIGVRHFKNIYSAEGTHIGLEVTKEFTGRIDDNASNINNWLDTDVFKFILMADPNDEFTRNAITNEEVILPTNAGGVSINKTTPELKETFGDITFNKAGTYRFLIKEDTTTHIAGVLYDDAPRYVNVVVEDKENKGVLSVTSVTIDDNRTLTFKNEYKTNETYIYGHDDLWVNKEFTGRPNNEWINDSFTFVLEAKEDYGSDVVIKNGQLTITNPDGGNHFGDIEFKKAGTYEFTVREVMPTGTDVVVNNDGSVTKDGITYDPSIKTIKVIVTDDGEGHLVAGIDDANSDPLTFTNTYQTGNTKLTAEQLYVEKRVVDHNGNVLTWNDYEFKFILEADKNDEFTTKAVQEGYVTFTSTELTLTKSKLNGENIATDTFGDITFTKPGVYKFVISEIESNYGNITNDTHKRYITVNVLDDGKGNLSLDTATATFTGEKLFSNLYTPNEITYAFIGTKTIDTRKLIDSDIFSFTITAKKENTPLPNKTTVENDIHGEIRFGLIHFTEAGVYEYVIKETGGLSFGVTNDTSSYEATIVINQESDGSLKLVSVTYTKDGDPYNGDNFEFVNKYQATVTEKVSVSAKKHFEDTSAAFEVKNDTFNFTLTPVQGNPDADPLKNGANGSYDYTGIGSANFDVSFIEDVEYNVAGTYRYVIKENGSNAIAGMTYDSTEYIMTVEVNEDVYNATLTPTVTYTKVVGNEETTVNSNELVFNNTFDPEHVYSSLGGRKNLTNISYDDAPSFEFKLTGYDNAPMPNESVTIKTDDPSVLDEPTSYITTRNTQEIINFGDIEYKEAGTYRYTIEEIIPEGATEENNYTLNGISYDSRIFNVTVTVSLNDVNAVQVEIDGLDDVIFNNTYSFNSVTVDGQIEATKELKGRPLFDEEFTFKLIDKDNNVVSTGTNIGKNIKFESFTINEEGTHYFEMVEDSTNKLAGVGYDLSVYTVEVVVADEVNGVQHQGQLTIKSIKYIKNNEYIDSVVFNNKYAPKGTSAEIGVTKVLNGRAIADGEFTFVIKDSDGKVVKEATNKGNTVLFDALDFNQAGIYDYTVEELAGNANGVDYDKTVYEFKVVVVEEFTEEGKYNGTLKATILNDEDEDFKVSFTNTYHAPVIDVKKVQIINGVEYDSEDGVVKVEEGQLIKYVIRATSEEGKATATNMIITDVIPEGLEVVSIDNNGTEKDGIITWTIEQLEAGKITEVSFTVKVPEVDKNTEWENIATVKFNNGKDPEKNDPNEEKESNKVDIKVELAPELLPVKSQSVNDGEATTEKVTIQNNVINKIKYIITVTAKDGTNDATNIVVSDKVPAGTTLVDGTITKGGVEKDGEIIWRFDSLKPGGSITVEFVVELSKGVDVEEINNQAEVTWEDEHDSVDDPDDFNKPTNEVEIDVEIPLSTETGDDAAIGLYVGFLSLSAISLGAFILIKKRKEN